MTTLANIRIKIAKLEKQLQVLKKEFEAVVKTIARPSSNKKGD